ncbi:hypothetical protein K440DRAFT_535711 [Wilcoxina mikolae CBS 423.85]|nr:hypothetical protein K440DRAFT_535711 [Wilcoxina mikolae CBS 423.85]
MPSFEDLPFELVSEILSIAAELNANDPDTVTYSYGLTQAPRPLQNKTYIQKYVRGRVPTDVLRWNSVDAIRQVNARWHHWALSHALKELYIRRWQGGETWMKRNFDNSPAVTHLPVVYQNPYKSVRCTAKLFHDYPSLAQHVRKIWFNGIYRFDTIGNVFDILENCVNVRTVTIPWTALRYGDSKDWDNVLSFPRLTSLELLAVPLKSQVCAMPKSHVDTTVLQRSLNFHNLRRLKIFGDSNLQPITDDDLVFMSHTATNLEEILITNVSTITARGVASLISASRNTLRLLEFIPLAKGGFEPPQSTAQEDDLHICNLLASCPRLQDLAVTLPSACPDLFTNPTIDWHETVRIRVGSTGVDNLEALLESARTLLEQQRRRGNDELDIEIAVGPYIFETKARLVHGSYKEAKIVSEMQWAPIELPSVKGPYGYTGLYGGGMKGEWSCISESDFLEAVRSGLVHLDS